MIRLIATRQNKFFFKVYAGEELLGGVPSSALRKLGINTAEEAVECSDEPAVAECIKQWVLENARDRLLGYVAKAEHTCYDCRNYLKKLYVPEDVIEVVLVEAVEQKWVSDERYAGFYAEDAFLSQMSPLDVKYKLMQKRVNPKVIDKAIKKVYATDNLTQMIEELIDKYIERNAGMPAQKLYQKIATTLYRKGFEYEVYEEILKRKL